ncbi:MAG: curved DNA-binding protein, partial [Kiritimatiellia bacterium]
KRRTMKDPYRVLGVSKSDDEDTIKKSYKKLVRKYHPDVNKDADAVERFQDVNSAWDVLQDPKKRKMYDQYGHVPGQGGGPPPGAGGRRGDPFGGGGFRADMGGGGVNMDDILSQMFGAGAAGGGYSRNRPGRDLHSTLAIDPMLTFTGGETSIVIKRPGNQQTETLRVKVPAGVEDGKTLRLRGRGHPPAGGGPAGDLHLKLTVTTHQVLRRIGADLEMDVPITVGEAVNGAVIRVPTPTGDVDVKVPAGAKNGQRMRLRSRGVQLKSGAGNLYLILRPHLPQNRDEAVLEAIEVLEGAYTADVRENLKL